jgi:hypothetical protein
MGPESANVPTPPDVPGPTAAPRPLPDWAKVPPLIARGNLQFKRDLPKLLKERPGQWVAYSGELCLGFARKQIDLAEACLRRGLKTDEFVVRYVEPWDPDEVDPEEYINE